MLDSISLRLTLCSVHCPHLMEGIRAECLCCRRKERLSVTGYHDTAGLSKLADTFVLTHQRRMLVYWPQAQTIVWISCQCYSKVYDPADIVTTEAVVQLY